MRGKKFKCVALLILFVVVASGVGGYSYIQYTLSKIQKVEVDKENLQVYGKFDKTIKGENTNCQNENNKNCEEKVQQLQNIRNILIIGTDTDENGNDYSALMMVASINKKNNQVKLSSINSSYCVNMNGEDSKDKISNSYVVGGPELAIQTVNKAFELNIEDFIEIDLSQLMDVVNYLGGMPINMNSEELEFINKHRLSDGHNSKLLQGVQGELLDGYQTLLYTRYEELSQNSSPNISKYKSVLKTIVNKAKGLSFSQYPDLINGVLSSMKTNMSNNDILSTVMKMRGISIDTLELESFPNVSSCETEVVNGERCYTMNENQAADEMYSYIAE